MGWFRGMTALAIAAALAPFVFFFLLTMMALGFLAMGAFPLIMAFVAWMILSSRARKERAELAKEGERSQRERPAREDVIPYPIETYTPPAHFDLLLTAKEEIGRIRGAAAAIPDAAIASQFRSLAEEADLVLAEVTREPQRLGLARRFFSSLLPRSADLAEGYFRAGQAERNEGRRAKLVDVLYRLSAAMKEARQTVASPEIARLDADLAILSQDLKDMNPTFSRAPQPILARVDDIVKSAKTKKI
jgi:GNAT superfamily N-acetyltransferase